MVANNILSDTIKRKMQGKTSCTDVHGFCHKWFCKISKPTEPSTSLHKFSKVKNHRILIAGKDL